MISSRSSSRIALQHAISSSVRPHPAQKPEAGFMTQTLMQGEEIIALPSVFSAGLEDAKLVAVEIAEVGAVEILAARARRAFILAAERQRLCVNLLHDIFR